MPGFRRDRARARRRALHGVRGAAPGRGARRARHGRRRDPRGPAGDDRRRWATATRARSRSSCGRSPLHRQASSRAARCPAPHAARSSCSAWIPRHGWRNVARARVRSTERFKVRWRADRTGRISLRAIVAAAPQRAASRAAAPIAKVTVYRPAMATYYGPGFFGQQTACGQIADARPARRRAQAAAVRHARRRHVRRPRDRRPGHRPRPVPRRLLVGPHAGHGRRARLHRAPARSATRASTAARAAARSASLSPRPGRSA